MGVFSKLVEMVEIKIQRVWYCSIKKWRIAGGSAGGRSDGRAGPPPPGLPLHILQLRRRRHNPQGMPPVSMNPPPMIINSSPVIMNQPPLGINSPPVSVNPPPVIMNPQGTWHRTSQGRTLVGVLRGKRNIRAKVQHPCFIAPIAMDRSAKQPSHNGVEPNSERKPTDTLCIWRLAQ